MTTHRIPFSLTIASPSPHRPSLYPPLNSPSGQISPSPLTILCTPCACTVGVHTAHPAHALCVPSSMCHAHALWRAQGMRKADTGHTSDTHRAPNAPNRPMGRCRKIEKVTVRRRWAGRGARKGAAEGGHRDQYVKQSAVLRRVVAGGAARRSACEGDALPFPPGLWKFLCGGESEKRRCRSISSAEQRASMRGMTRRRNGAVLKAA